MGKKTPNQIRAEQKALLKPKPPRSSNCQRHRPSALSHNLAPVQFEALECGAEQEIIIARNGKPAARLVPIAKAQVGQQIGAAKGKFVTPELDTTLESEIAALFNGGHA